MISDDEVRTRLAKAGLSKATAQVLEGALEEIWITATRRDDFGPTASRIGGAPHLPEGVPWPHHRWTRAEVDAWPDYARTEIERALAEGTVVVEPDVHGNLDGDVQLARALSFVAQIDLSVVAAPLLPARGHLWLFVDQLTVVGEVEGRYHHACACLYADAPGDIAIAAPPTLDSLPGYALAFAPSRSFPDDIGARGNDWNRYSGFLKDVGQSEPRHAMLVRPLYTGNGLLPPEGHVALFRVDSDYHGDEIINWGDASFMTFAIREDDLAARRFSEVRAFHFDG